MTSERAWFAEPADAFTCALIALELRHASIYAQHGHGRSRGAAVQLSMRAGIELGRALALADTISDKPTQARARELAAVIGALASLTLECPGHELRCMGLGKAELAGE